MNVAECNKGLKLNSFLQSFPGWKFNRQLKARNQKPTISAAFFSSVDWCRHAAPRWWAHTELWGRTCLVNSKCCGDVSPMTASETWTVHRSEWPPDRQPPGLSPPQGSFLTTEAATRKKNYWFFLYHPVGERGRGFDQAGAHGNQSHSIPINNIPGRLLKPPSSQRAPLQHFYQIVDFNGQKSVSCWCNPFFFFVRSMNSTLISYWVDVKQ